MAEAIRSQQPEAAAADAATGATDDASFLSLIIAEVCSSYVNMALCVAIAVLVYKIFKGPGSRAPSGPPPPPPLPALRRDFTIQELKPFNGTQEDGRVLMAVNGTVYDVTKGKSFYGPGGPYAAFAGRDASRGLATFSVTAADDDKYDDLSDLGKMEMDSVREWEMQFNEKYLVVGKLLKPGEEATNYDEEEQDEEAEAAAAAAAGDKKAAAAAGEEGIATPESEVTNVGTPNVAAAADSTSKPKAE